MAGSTNFSGMAGDLRDMALSFAAISASTAEINSSIQTWRQFSAQITLANAVAHGTALEFDHMSQAAQNFSLSSKASLTEVSGALYYLNSAGYSVTESLVAMTSIIQLAQATMTDFAQAAQLVVTTTSAFGLAANDTARVANVFVAAAHDSQATIQKLSFAMRQVGPAAAEMNVSLEDTVAYLDLMFNAGLSGQQAGTALRNVMVRLVEPMGVGKALFKNLGVEIYDTAGRMRNFDDIMLDLSKDNISLGEASQLVGRQSAVAFLTMLKGMQPVVDATGQLTSKFREQQQALARQELYRQFVIQMNTLDGAMHRAANAGNELKLMLGQSLSPVISDASNNFADFVHRLKDTDDQTKITWVEMALLGAGTFVLGQTILRTIPMIGTFAGGLTALKDGGIATFNAFQEIQAGTIGVEAGLARAGTAAAGAAQGFGAMLSTALGFVGVVAVLGAITFALIEMEKAREAVDMARLKESTFAGESAAHPERYKLGGPSAYDLSQDQGPAIKDLQRNIAQVPDQNPTGMGPDGFPVGFAEQNKAYQTQVDNIKTLMDENNHAIQTYQELKGKASAQNSQIAIARNALLNTLGGEDFTGGAGQDLLHRLSASRTVSSQEIIAALQGLANANPNDLSAAIQNYYTQIDKGITDDTQMSNGLKENLKKSFAKFGEAMASASPEARAQLMASLSRLSGDLQGGDTNAAEDELQKMGNIDKGLLDKLIKQADANNGQLLIEQQEARARMAANHPQVVKEIQGMAQQIAANNKEFGTALAQAVKVDPNFYSEAASQLNDSFADTRTVMDKLLQLLKAKHIELQQHVVDTIDSIVSTLDPTAQDTAVARMHVGLMRGLRQDAKGMTAGLRASMQALIGPVTDQQAEEIKAAGGEARAQFAQKIAGSFGVTERGVATQLTPLANAIFGDPNQKYTAADITAMVDKYGAGIKDKGNVAKLAIAAYGDYLKAVAGEQQADFNVANKGAKAGAAQERRDDTDLARLIGLPTPEEFQATMDKLTISNKYFFANWLHMPIQTAQGNLEQAKRDADKELADLTKEFYKYFTDVVKGTRAGGDKDLAQAFRESPTTGNESAVLDRLGMELPKDGAFAERMAVTKTLMDRYAVEWKATLTKGQLGVRKATEEALAVDQDQIQAISFGADIALLQTQLDNISKLGTGTPAGVARRIISEQIAKQRIDAEHALAAQANTILGAKFGVNDVDAFLKDSSAYSDQLSSLSSEESADLNRIVEEYQKSKKSIDDANDAQTAFFNKHHVVMEMATDVEAAAKAWKDMDGALSDAILNMDKLREQSADTHLNNILFGASGGNIQGGTALFKQINSAVIAKRQAGLSTQYEQRVDETMHSAASDISMGADPGSRNMQRDKELGDLATAYDEAMQRITTSLDTTKESLDAYVKAQKELTDNNSDTSLQKFGEGVHAGLAKTFHDLPTDFDIGVQAISSGINGMSDLFTKMALGMKVNFRQATAQILGDIAQMIIKTLILKAIQSAMGFGGGGSGGYDMGSVPFANGGISYYGLGGNHASAMELYGGGIKQPHQPTVAVFGEGMHREAFIPMLDGKTVGMAFDHNGNPMIPLPSGKSIPVSMAKSNKFADGGATMDNLLTAAGTSGSARSGSAAPNIQLHMGNHTSNIHFHGDGGGKSDQDKTEMVKMLADHVNRVMDEREYTFTRSLIKQGGLLSGSHSASGGFGKLR